MRLDWRKLDFKGWLFTLGSVGFLVYGIYCIVTQQGMFVVPFHSIEQGSIGDGMHVQGTAAVRVGIAYILFALFLGGSAFCQAHPQPSENMYRNIFFLFVASVVCLFWALFSM